MDRITTPDDLRRLYGSPSERAVKKEMRRLDRHATAFLALSPFVLVGSSAADGSADVSPRGDVPGFVAALDERTIALPDRPGNNRLDTLENVLANPAVGLLFLVPGMDETLRINGRAEIRTDPDLLQRFAHAGKLPISVLVVHVEAVYLHCAKAFMRSDLWNPEGRIERKGFPTLGAMLKDQIALTEEVDEIDRWLDERAKATLY